MPYNYFWQERRAKQVGVVPNEPLSPDARRALIHWGGLLGILSIFFFIVPQALIAIAPWQMTALTARVALILQTSPIIALGFHHDDRSAAPRRSCRAASIQDAP
jgi:hypothetical protein